MVAEMAYIFLTDAQGMSPSAREEEPADFFAMLVTRMRPWKELRSATPTF